MKKKILLLLICLIPISVKAASIGISCPSSVTAGEVINCSLTAYHESLSALSAGVTYSGASYFNSVNKTGSGFFNISAYKMDGTFDLTYGSIGLATYIFSTSTPGTFTISVSGVSIIDGSFNTISGTGDSKSVIITPKTTAKADDNKRSNYVIDVKPTPSPGTTTTYPAYKDNTLSSLSIDNYRINFLRELYTYSIVVPENVTAVKINYEVTNSANTVTVTGNDNLNYGENKVLVTVTTPTGETKTYTIVVYRGNSLLNGDNSNKKVTIDNYSLNFKSTTYNYDLDIKNDQKLNITVIPNSKTTNYQIINNDKLEDGSVIIIRTNAQDSTTKDYTIKVHFVLDTLNPYAVYIPLSLIIGFSLGYGIYYIHNKRKIKKIKIYSELNQ